MERFITIQPAPVLTPYVKHYWLLESDDVSTIQRVIPSGNVELLFYRACPMARGGVVLPQTVLSGQSLSFADLQPTGVVSIVAVVFRPFGAKAFFDLPISELSNLVVSPDELGIVALKELEERLCYASDDGACVRLIEQFLLGRMNPLKEYNFRRMEVAVGLVNRRVDDLSVVRLAEEVCLSKKQFNRLFAEYVGATPKEFMRIVRFHKALFTLQKSPSISFAALAYECGYFDQAHLINEFKLLSGYTPRQYVAICAPFSDYFSE